MYALFSFGAMNMFKNNGSETGLTAVCTLQYRFSSVMSMTLTSKARKLGFVAFKSLQFLSSFNAFNNVVFRVE